jgi:hypothetical protein
VGKELAALRGKDTAPKAGDKVAKGTEVSWPFDLNSAEFREGVRKAEDAPAWGYDPDHGEAAKR